MIILIKLIRKVIKLSINILYKTHLLIFITFINNIILNNLHHEDHGV